MYWIHGWGLDYGIYPGVTHWWWKIWWGDIFGWVVGGGEVDLHVPMMEDPDVWVMDLQKKIEKQEFPRIEGTIFKMWWERHHGRSPWILGMLMWTVRDLGC
jgi:hypothetical protein